MTVVAGSLSSTAACTVGGGTPVDKYGDGCPASDGVANLNGGYTGNFNKPRGVLCRPQWRHLHRRIRRLSRSTRYRQRQGSCPSSPATSTAPHRSTQAAPARRDIQATAGTATNYQVVNGTPQLSPTGGAELYQPRASPRTASATSTSRTPGDNAIRVVYQGGASLASLINIETGLTAQAGYIYTIAGNATKTFGGGNRHAKRRWHRRARLSCIVQHAGRCEASILTATYSSPIGQTTSSA